MNRDGKARPKERITALAPGLLLLSALLAGCATVPAADRQALGPGGVDTKGSLVILENAVRVECLDPEGRIFYEDMREVLEVFDDLSRRVYMERAGGELLSGRAADHLTCRFVPLETPAGRSPPQGQT